MDLGKERMRLIMYGTNSNGNETSVWVTFAGKEEREVVYHYTKDIGFTTFKKYLDNLLFDQEPPEELLPVKRNIRYSDFKVKSPIKYIYKLTESRKGHLQGLATQNGIPLTLYISARIKTDMSKHGYNFPDHLSKYIVFYRDAEQENSMCTDSLESALKKIRNEKRKGSQDIWLVDVLQAKRKLY